MKPRYFTRIGGFEGEVLYVKICDEGTFSIGANGRVVCSSKDQGYHVIHISDALRYVNKGIWREVPIEELVLMFPI